MDFTCPVFFYQHAVVLPATSEIQKVWEASLVKLAPFDPLTSMFCA